MHLALEGRDIWTYHQPLRYISPFQGWVIFFYASQGAALVIPHISEIPHDELVIWRLSIQGGLLYDMECGDEVTALDWSGAWLGTTRQIQGEA